MRIEFPHLRSGEPFRMKGGEVERVKGIEPSTRPQRQ